MTTTGPNYPGTTADDSAVGTLTWGTTGNVVSDNNVDCAVTFFAGPTDTHYLKVTNFGFSIADTQIDGITVEFEKYRNTTANVAKDAVVKLVIGGTVSGSNLADTGTTYPTSRTTTTYGGSSNLWGLTPSVADINGSGFGVVLSCTCNKSGKGAGVISVDFVRITITSSSAASGQPTSKRFGGVPFMGAHGAGIPSAVRQWMRRDSGLLAPRQATAIWRPAHGID